MSTCVPSRQMGGAKLRTILSSCQLCDMNDDSDDVQFHDYKYFNELSIGSTCAPSELPSLSDFDFDRSSLASTQALAERSCAAEESSVGCDVETHSLVGVRIRFQPPKRFAKYTGVVIASSGDCLTVSCEDLGDVSLPTGHPFELETKLTEETLRHFQNQMEVKGIESGGGQVDAESVSSTPDASSISAAFPGECIGSLLTFPFEDPCSSRNSAAQVISELSRQDSFSLASNDIRKKDAYTGPVAGWRIRFQPPHRFGKYTGIVISVTDGRLTVALDDKNRGELTLPKGHLVEKLSQQALKRRRKGHSRIEGTISMTQFLAMGRNSS